MNDQELRLHWRILRWRRILGRTVDDDGVIYCASRDRRPLVRVARQRGMMLPAPSATKIVNREPVVAINHGHDPGFQELTSERNPHGTAYVESVIETFDADPSCVDRPAWLVDRQRAERGVAP